MNKEAAIITSEKSITGCNNIDLVFANEPIIFDPVDITALTDNHLNGLVAFGSNKSKHKLDLSNNVDDDC